MFWYLICYIFRKAQFLVKSVIEHVLFRVFTVLLILVDVTLVVVDISVTDLSNETSHNINLVSRIIVSYFLIEIGFRIFYRGWALILFDVRLLLFIIYRRCFSLILRTSKHFQEQKFNIYAPWYKRSLLCWAIKINFTLLCILLSLNLWLPSANANSKHHGSPITNESV